MINISATLLVRYIHHLATSFYGDRKKKKKVHEKFHHPYPKKSKYPEAHMIYLKTLLNVIDNSGAQVVECIKVLRHNPKSCAHIGDQITCVVKQARPTNVDASSSGSSSAQASNRVKRRDICRAVVVRQRAPFRRPDGSVVRFDDNACVLINKNGEPLGTRISSVVAKELRDLNYNKIVSLAPKTF